MDTSARLIRFGGRVVARAESARWLRPAALAVLLIVLTAFSRQQAGVKPAGLPTVLLLGAVLLCGAGLLSWKRVNAAARLALFSVLLVASAGMIYLDAGGPGYVGGFVAASVAAAQPRRVPSAVMAGLALVVLGVAPILGTDRSPASIVIAELGALAFYLAGRYSRRLRQRTEQAARLRLELEQSKVAQARGALLAERQRVAREMHDVLAHSLSGLVVQLEGARLLAATAPGDERLPPAVDRAHQLARSGLEEARQAIGMLRGDELPGPGRLPELANGFAADTGVPCRFTEAGPPRELVAAVRLALYRVAQEGLTNVRKHARPDRVEVRLEYRPDAVTLTVQDFGPSRAGDAEACGDAEQDIGAKPGSGLAAGYGLTGMRERAGLLGGSLDASRTPDGFRVRLRVPA
jgi:signal transduction histidine kinase